MTKCDFCRKSSPNGECSWHSQTLRERDCKVAIQNMIQALQKFIILDATSKKLYFDLLNKEK